MKNLTAACLVALLLAGSACSRIKAAKPEGFAETIGKNYYKAVSPEGVIYKVRYVKNYPQQELDFWGRALKKHLQGEGYRFIEEESFSAGTIPGLLFEWGAPYGTEDYIYLTAIIVAEKRIVIAEAAAEYRLYNRYRGALVDSLASIQIR